MAAPDPLPTETARNSLQRGQNFLAEKGEPQREGEAPASEDLGIQLSRSVLDTTSDTPRSKATGVLPSSSPLARSGPTRASRGGLSRSVLYARWSTRFRMPYGTVYCLLQDVVK